MIKKVTLIVPFYNSAKTLDKCLKSILSQTYKNFEAICVNDGSTDNSREIVYGYSLEDQRIKLIDKKHGGVSSARNVGLDNATGDYIQFVDSDDWIEPHMVETMLETSIRENADIVVCNYTHPSIKNYLGSRVLNISNHNELIQYYQTTFAVVVPWNKLYRKEVIKTRFDEEVHFCEDDLFGLANMFNAKKVVGIDDILYHYYVAPEDTSEEELSCINKLAKADDFWLTKKTYWYMRMELLQKSQDILKKCLNEKDAEDFAYARAFDFMIWEILILNSVGVDLQGLIYEMNSIFREQRFIKSITMREKYGITFNEYSEEQLTQKVTEYVKKCCEIAKEIEKKNLKLRPFFVCLMLFAKDFIKPISNDLDTTDLVVGAFVELKNNNTSEAQYVNAICA